MRPTTGPVTCLPELPGSECEEDLNERIGVPVGESREIPQETERNWLEMADGDEVWELADTNEMVLVS